MNIIVVGCGKIGSTLVESLSAEGHDVVALEKDAHVLEQITNMYDVMGVCGNGALGVADGKRTGRAGAGYGGAAREERAARDLLGGLHGGMPS